ncbi:hypothetical protein KJK34_10370 [Flavobacterium sp. D11R37]|jgi:hypothetical protein|uniref:hypothetical protein n=1 Tax=Flavobacterium TaxID=237 RepID=UPI001CA754C1|nr:MULTISPECIES: hypothetical protein [Flavobacterium]MBY8963156.1 hypothetical protein [Flavobacterium coralii]MCR5863509.1 hypothetical protein [Flavobacterium sp. J372]
MIDIRVEEDIVNFYKDGRSKPIYFIERAKLYLTREDKGILVSEWIEHLILKSWIEAEALYELARLIQKEFPDNKINWYETFFPVEKWQYLQHVKHTTKLISGTNSEVNFKSLMDGIQAGIDEQRSDVNAEINKIVEMNLRQFNLL